MAKRVTRESSDAMAERIGEAVVRQIEEESLHARMSITDAAMICRSVARELNSRAALFDDEAGVD